jgi:hypothetical protein
MPVTVKKQQGRWRVVEASTGKIAKNKAGTPVDGGGHNTEMGAKAQARAVNRKTES